MRSTMVLLVIVLLVGSSTLLMAFDSWEQPRHQARARALQERIGGLGFGPSANLSSCPFGYDPRLGPDCAHRYGPIAGGETLCPHHAGSVFAYPALRQADRAVR
jgi:hypothetical protein